MGITYSKFHLGRYIIGSRFTAPLGHHCKTNISDCISDDIPPQMKILNTVIPYLLIQITLLNLISEQALISTL